MENSTVNVNIDLIIGQHSISAALSNPERICLELAINKKEEANIRAQLKKEGVNFANLTSKNFEIKSLNPDNFHSYCQKKYKEFGYEYNKVKGNALLVANRLKIYQSHEILNDLKNSQGKKIICLDQVTDVQNRGAILRTAAFYGVDYVVLVGKHDLTLPPGLFRASSGSTELLKMANIGNLSKFIFNLQNMEQNKVLCVGLSEREKNEFEEDLQEENFTHSCLVLGAEDKGISNAVVRVLKKIVSLGGLNPNFTTLNVSVASAVAMERFFNSKNIFNRN